MVHRLGFLMETLKFLQVSTHFPPTHLGGDAKFVENLSNELARAGHEVHVLHNPSVFRYVRKRDSVDHVTTNPSGVHMHVPHTGTSKLDLLVSLGFGNSASTKRLFEDVLKDVKPDVVHWHNTKGFIASPLPSGQSQSLFTAHDYFVVCPRYCLLRPGYGVCESPLLCQTCLIGWKKIPELWRIGGRRVVRLPKDTIVITPSDFAGRRLEQDGVKVHHVLRNFALDSLREMGNTRAEKSLLYVGLLEKQKGVLTLVDAFTKSCSEHGFDLWMLGEGYLKKKIREVVDAAGLADRIHVPGFVPIDQSADILRDTAAMIVPSLSYENAPLAALEAFSASIPVIGSDIGGLPEILGSTSGSSTFPAGDSSRLAQEMKLLWNHRDQLPERRRLAREAYEREFSPRVHINRYLKIVSRIPA